MRALSLSRIVARALAACIGMGVAACGPQYEIDRPGTWQPTGANDRNLRAMIADPRDLGYGAASTTERASGASRAVTRLLIDRRRPLLNVSLSRLAPSSDAQDTPLGGGGGPSASGAPAP